MAKVKTPSGLEYSKKRRFRLLPLTITMLSLLLLIKLNDVYINSRELREVYGVREAAAEEKKEEAKHEGDAAKPDAKPAEGDHAKEGDAKPADAKAGEAAAGDAKPAEGDTKKEDAGHGDAKKEEKKPDEPKTLGTGKTTIKAIEELKAKEATPMYTQAEIELLQNLSKRRDELDKRDADLNMKSKLLEAGEKRIDDKLAQMKALQVQLEKVVAQYNEKQSAQIKSLVKIYENMKPGDAANIFNQMDMPILLEVIDKMSERKVAPVLAAMDPKKAKDVTQELAEMRRSTNAAIAGASGAPAKP